MVGMLISRRSTLFWVVLFLLVCAPKHSNAAQLSIASATAGPGDLVPIALDFTPGAEEQVASCQVDIVFDSTMASIFDVTAGPAATDASKDVNFSIVQPGRLRIIVSGANQNAISAGTLASIDVQVANTAQGELQLDGEEPVASSPQGVDVPIQVSDGQIQVQGEPVEAEGGQAELSIGSATANPGDVGIIKLDFTPAPQDQVAACQVDIVFNADMMSVSDVSPGLAATGASKDVNFSLVETGRIRIIVSGANQNAISAGTLAEIEVQVANTAQGEIELDGEEPVASSPQGVGVPIQVSDGKIEVQAEEGEGPTLTPTPPGGLFGCPIALMAHGNVLSRQLDVLRAWRDCSFAGNVVWKSGLRFYYSHLGSLVGVVERIEMKARNPRLE